MNVSLRLRPFAPLRLVFPYLAVYLFYLAIAMLITWPLVTVLAAEFAGFPDSDAYEMGRHIWWFKHALQTGQPIFYQTTLGYPEGIDGSVLMWANPLQFFPAWLFAFAVPLPAAYNLTQLLTMALNGWAMQRLVYELTGGRQSAALLAGVVFMAAPTFQGHLAGGHGGLMVMWPTPLFLYALFRLRDSADRRWIVQGALFFFLSPGGHVLQAIYVLLPIAAVFVIACILWRERAWLARGLLAMAMGSGALVIYQIPSARATLDIPAYEEAGGFVRYSADLLAIVTPSFFHPISGNFEYTHRVLGINIIEGSSYIGIVAGLLALVAVWRLPQSRWWLALGVVAWILSLGPLIKLFDQPVLLNIGGYDTYIPLPWAAVQNLPVFTLARTPARFNFVMPLALAVMAGYGIGLFEPRRRNPEDIRLNIEESPLHVDWSESSQQLQPASSRLPEPLATGLPAGGGEIQTNRFVNAAKHWALLALAIALILFEYQSFWPFPTTPAAIPAAVTALAARGDIRVVFNLPWDNVLAAKEALFLQTGHQRPLIAGQITRRTPVSPAKLTILEQTLDPVLLDAASVDIIIVHKKYDDGAHLAFARQQLGAALYEDDWIAVFEVPESSRALQFASLVTPQDTISRQVDSYLYAPESGWVQFTGVLRGNERTVQLLLDSQPVHTWTVDGSTAFSLPVPVSEAGYHTITLSLSPPCPLNFNPALECDGVRVANLALEGFTPAAFDSPITFERGVRLAGAHISDTALAGESVSLTLWWRFDQPRGEFDVRFVHILDEDGNPATQSDSSLGQHPAGSQWVEIVDLALPADLPAGTYNVYTGWYTNPDAERFAVLSDVPGAENGLALAGTLVLLE